MIKVAAAVEVMMTMMTVLMMAVAVALVLVLAAVVTAVVAMRGQRMTAFPKAAGTIAATYWTRMTKRVKLISKRLLLLLPKWLRPVDKVRR